MAGPLSGCRVIELAGLGPGPFASMLLADMGADVIRVDRLDPPLESARLYVMNRGRRSISLDLKQPAGREVFLRLVDHADALIEGFRPGVMERLGLGPAECRARNPRMVYGRMTGWGQEGPLAKSAGHDINYIALSGALSCIARDGERPVPPVNFLGDFGGGGMLLAVGLAAALWHAQRTGQGQVVDAAMVDGSALITTMLHGLMAQGRWVDHAGSNFADSGSNYYDTYRCADDRFIAVGALEGPFYAALLRGLGLDGEDLPARADPANWTELKQRFAAVIATKPREEWARIFEGTDACVAPVLSLTEAPHHPHNVHRAVFVEHGGIVQPAPAPRFEATPSQLDRMAPIVGEHTGEILGELGYTEEEIVALDAARAVRLPANQ